MSSNRLIFYDFVPIIACVFIVIRHSPFPTEYVNGWFLVALSFLLLPKSHYFL